MKRHPDEVKQKCQRDECSRERYELIQSPMPEDKRFVCNNCWNYLYKQAKKSKEAVQ